jgi:hypothetical protein
VQSLFEPEARRAILDRLARLEPSAARQWGTMDVAQMLAHCSAALEVATGDTPRKQAFIGKVLAPFARSSFLGEKPMKRNSPTDPAFVVSDPRVFDEEKRRLADLINRFSDAGPEKAAVQTHSFFGSLTGEEWARLMYKHLDHHLRQFGG